MRLHISKRRSPIRRCGYTLTPIILPVLICLFLGTLSSESMSQETSVEDQNKKLVLKMYNEFDLGRLDEFRPLISPDFTAHVMGNMSMDWEGFVEFGAQFLFAFPNGRHVFDYVIADGDYVVTVGRYLGTHEGELMGIAPSHRQIDLAVMHLDRVVDGRIMEHRGIGNAMDLMNQLGVSTGK